MRVTLFRLGHHPFFWLAVPTRLRSSGLAAWGLASWHRLDGTSTCNGARGLRLGPAGRLPPRTAFEVGTEVRLAMFASANGR